MIFRAVRWMIRLTVRLAVAFTIIVVIWVGAYRWINPPTTWLITSEVARLGTVNRQWISLSDMSPHLPRTAMAAEDARFCTHWGFDFEEIEKALAGGAARGASTISQQVAKNAFLWPERSWVRKGAEAGFTLLIEALWPKRRIIEVYLNVAEFGEGVFGVKAGAQAAFNRSAADLSLHQSARLIAVLPNPKNRDANAQDRRGARIADGAQTLKADGRASCVE